MSLRARLAIAFCAIALILAGAFVLVASRQQGVLTNQLDAQLESISHNSWRLVDPVKPAGAGAASRVPSDTYVGVLGTGSLRTIVEPGNGLVPEVTASELAGHASLGSTSPFTVAAVSGAGHIRIVAVETSSGWVVTGISTARVASAVGQLELTSGAALVAVLAVLAVLLLWVGRLGLRPIRKLTEAAEEIAEGRLDLRVSAGDQNTEAGRLATAFNLMVEARQKTEERLRRFVSDASHELRTPLTVLRGYAALLASGGLTEPEEVEDALRRLEREATRMSVLVDDLLALASLDEQRPLTLEPVDLRRVIEDAAADAQAIQPARPITVTAAESVTALADPHSIVQVVTALVSNALRHTAESASVGLAAMYRNGSALVTVHDGGPGIPAAELDRIFERFYRLAPGRERSKGGSGLGLSIVRSTIEAQGGSVTVASRPGAGTTFTVTLPADPGCVAETAGGATALGGRPS